MTAQTPRIFAQQYAPTPSSPALYTVESSPVAHFAQLSIFISNHSPVLDYVSVALVPSSQNLTSNKNYIAYNTPLIGNGVLAFASISLGSGDSIRVVSANGTSSFTATGMDFY